MSHKHPEPREQNGWRPTWESIDYSLSIIMSMLLHSRSWPNQCTGDHHIFSNTMSISPWSPVLYWWLLPTGCVHRHSSLSLFIIPSSFFFFLIHTFKLKCFFHPCQKSHIPAKGCTVFFVASLRPLPSYRSCSLSDRAGCWMWELKEGKNNQKKQTKPIILDVSAVMDLLLLCFSLAVATLSRMSVLSLNTCALAFWHAYLRTSLIIHINQEF